MWSTEKMKPENLLYIHLSRACSLVLNAREDVLPKTIPTPNSSHGPRAVSMKVISAWNVTGRSTGSNAVSRKATSAFVSLMKLPEKKRRITKLYGTSCAAACLKLLMIIPLALDS